MGHSAKSHCVRCAVSSNVRAELICDGFHVTPPVVRLAFAAFGPERMVMISDALRCSGMPDSEYKLGGKEL